MSKEICPHCGYDHGHWDPFVDGFFHDECERRQCSSCGKDYFIQAVETKTFKPWVDCSKYCKESKSCISDSDDEWEEVDCDHPSGFCPMESDFTHYVEAYKIVIERDED